METSVSRTFELTDTPTQILLAIHSDRMVYLSASSATVQVGYSPESLAYLFYGPRGFMFFLEEGYDLWARSDETGQTIGILTAKN